MVRLPVMTTESRARLVVALLLAATAIVALAAPAGAAAKFGPPIKKCGPLKGAAKKACKDRNRSARQAFNAVKDSRFTGTLFNGTTLDATFCANGHWQVIANPTGEPLTFSGKQWKLEEPFARGNLLALMARGPSDNIYTRVGLQRRGGVWHFSDGNPRLSAPKATKSSAAAACQTL